MRENLFLMINNNGIGEFIDSDHIQQLTAREIRSMRRRINRHMYELAYKILLRESEIALARRNHKRDIQIQQIHVI